jgi:hypothetical protein
MADINSNNATPPSDFPEQVIVMDKELVARHPDKVFYLRVIIPDGTDVVPLDGAITPGHAREMARRLGYNPTHWVVVPEGQLNKFYL